MAANTNPIFPLNPRCAGTTLTSAATEKDGSTAASLLAAGANGTRLDKIVAKSIGTNVATVLRVFVCGTGMNTIIREQSIAASSASETEALAEYVLTFDESIPSGATLKVALGTAVSGGIQVTAFGGDY
jgi:hypothetical protein